VRPPEVYRAINAVTATLADDGKRPKLRAISRERPDLYAALGEFFSLRRQVLLTPPCPPKRARKPYVRRDKAAAHNEPATNFVLVEA
jgi:hypothetical protein